MAWPSDSPQLISLHTGLDDLCARFIINLPADDLASVQRICFQVEEAQWYYEDFIRPLDPSLPSLSLRNFCLRIFSHCPLLSGFVTEGRHMQAFEEFLMYKKRVPVRGAILLNEAMDSAVLVKGWKKGANWSFPRGKINKDEDDLICAIREVYEETGYDLDASGLVPGDRNVKSIEVNMHEQQVRLYVFRDVPMDTYFEPRTRKEISKIQWWRLSELPAFRKKNQQEQPQTAGNAKFYMVAPFLVPLRKWIMEQKKLDAKRATSNQYLSAGMSHDEFLTEEDRGEESNTQGPSYPPASEPHPQTLEEATAALTRLLKIQPPTQGLQAEAMSATQSPAVKSSGQALLALLQSKPVSSNEILHQNPPSHTPLDHTIKQAPIPTAPHHHPPRPPHFSSMPPPPSFPIQAPSDSFSYQLPNLQNDTHRSNVGVFQTGQNQQPPLRRQENPHSHQSQHLIHPQPLPPHVQRAVFTGGPAHPPMVPQPILQHTQPHLSSTVSVPVPNPHFPGLHAPMVPSAPKQSPPKLTSHSLALLNAFRSRDQATGHDPTSNDLPLRRYGLEPAQAPPPPPQELPAELSQPTPPAPVPHASSQRNNYSSYVSNGAFTAKKPISESHRATLLDLFKSPTSQAAVVAKPATATALPTSNTPSAVELSAVEPLSSNAASTSALLNDKRTPDHGLKNGLIPILNPEANLPFRAMSILARPSEVSDNRVQPNSPSRQKTPSKSNGKKPVAKASNKEPVMQPPEKPFQPQILKRPQPGTTKATGSLQSTPPSFPSIPIQPSLDRHLSQPPDHKQTLLSLFGKGPSTVYPLSKNPPTDVSPRLNTINPTTNVSARSRVGSLASVDAASRRGSQTPISPADKGFLLSYLDAVANGIQR